MELCKQYFGGKSAQEKLVDHGNNDHQPFLCVDKLSTSGIYTPVNQKAPHFWVELYTSINFQAAKKAASCLAFKHSFTYCQNALELLTRYEENNWQRHYDLILGLNTKKAEVYLLPTGEN